MFEHPVKRINLRFTNRATVDLRSIVYDLIVKKAPRRDKTISFTNKLDRLD